MSELSLATRKEVARVVSLKAVVVNTKGDLSVDGTVVKGLDGQRGLAVFFEGVGQDVKEIGHVDAEKLYRKLSRTPGRLGKSVQTALNFSRQLDAETLAKR